MVGLGSKDTLDEAKEFASRYGVSFTMLWDGSGRSWRELGITGQPAAVLLARDGSVVERWFGPFPEDEVVRLAASS